MQKIRQMWLALGSSLWFIPGLMIAASIILAFLLVEVDGRVNRELLLTYPRIFGLGSDGSRGMLTAIAGSMLTVAALAFSLTLSIIAQASGQYSPRILRNFMRDRLNQFVLGYFVSVFAYCLIVLRTIRGADELKFVPSLAVVTGLVLAIGGIIVLIFFIHHIAASLQITNIIDKIVNETTEAINKIFPVGMGYPPETETEKKEAELLLETDYWFEIPASSSGYIQYIDVDGLLEYAVENSIVLRMEKYIGQFVGKGEVLTSVISDAKTKDVFVTDEMKSEINSYFQIHRFRSIEQDIGYGIRQIVDIALKALSPGVNDTTTGIICIDNLGVVVSDLATRKFPSDIRVKDERVRVFVNAPAFESYVETAFDQIRISGKGNQAVFQRLLAAIALIGKNNNIKERDETLRGQIRLISEFAEQTLETEYERQKVINAAVKARKVLKS